MITPYAFSNDHPPTRPLQAQVAELIAVRQRQVPAENPDIATLRSCLQDIYANLNCHPGFSGLVNMAKRFVPVPGIPAFSTTIAQASDYRLSLMGIHRQRPVPMHDHPGSAGVSLMLAGHARIRHFDPAPEQDWDTGLVCLEWNVDGEFRCGDFDGYLPYSGNIHDISAISTSAVLLSLQLPPTSRGRQSWYFPLELLGNADSGLLCRRIEQRRTVTPAGLDAARPNRARFPSEIRM